MQEAAKILQHLQQRFGAEAFQQQYTVDDILTLWTPQDKIVAVIQYLKSDIEQPFVMLYDLCGIDERDRTKKEDMPASDFTIVYHLFSFTRNHFIRIKVALQGEYPSLPSISSIFINANWYEREVYDMFGIRFSGHPHLQRILMPFTWQGHPLRKEHPARATEMGPYLLWDEKQDIEQEGTEETERGRGEASYASQNCLDRRRVLRAVGEMRYLIPQQLMLPGHDKHPPRREQVRPGILLRRYRPIQKILRRKRLAPRPDRRNLRLQPPLGQIKRKISQPH